MAFLEPIALGKPLLGRDLPEITRDFKREQISLGQLYDQLLVPVSWIDQTALFQCLERSLKDTYSRYGEELTVNATVSAGKALVRKGYVDFGNLPEEFQREAAVRAFREPGEVLVSIAGQREPAAAWLAEALRLTTPSSPPSSLDRFSVSHYSDLLAGLYQDLQQRESAPPRWLDKSRVLHQFLQPGRFHFLRT